MPITDLDTYDKFAAHVALRPAMYLGSRNSPGVLLLLKGILTQFIHLSGGHQPFITVFVENDRTYKISVKGTFNKENILEHILTEMNNTSFYLSLLSAVSERVSFFISDDNETYSLNFRQGAFIGEFSGEKKEVNGLTVDFELSNTIFSTYPDYFEVGEVALELAMLNKDACILLENNLLPVSSRIFYHFPDGIIMLFDRKCRLGNTAPNAIFIDERYKKNYYQIGIAFPRSYQDEPIISYAGNSRTKNGGSLEDGIVLGIIGALTKFIKAKNPADVDYLLLRKSKSNFKSRLILVCKVECPNHDYDYEGATKERIYMPGLKKDVKDLVSKKMLSYFEANPEQAEKMKSFF